MEFCYFATESLRPDAHRVLLPHNGRKGGPRGHGGENGGDRIHAATAGQVLGSAFFSQFFLKFNASADGTQTSIQECFKSVFDQFLISKTFLSTNWAEFFGWFEIVNFCQPLGFMRFSFKNLAFFFEG